MEAMPVGVFVAEPNGHPFYANKQGESLLGRGVMPRVELHEMAEVYQVFIAGTDELYAPEDLPIARALNGESCYVQEMEIRRPEDTIWVDVWGTPIFDDNGKVEYALAAFADVSDRRQAAQELQFLGAVTANMAEGVVVVNVSDAKVTYANASGEKMFGYGPGELVGAPIDQLTLPTAEPAGTDFIAQTLAQTGHWSGEIEVVRKDGTRFWSNVNISEIHHQQLGSVWIAVHSDITDRKLAALELETMKDQALEASRLKSQFLANMSHEIRTPMNGVLGMAQLLLQSDLDPTQRRRTEALRESGQNLLAIINDILDFSKVEAGKLELETKAFDLRASLKSVMDLLASPAYNKGLALDFKVDEDVPAWVVGDPLRVRQVLINILGNAVKFTEKGSVGLRVKRTAPGRLMFEVKDTGIGIDPADRIRLLDPFSQADASTTRRFGGTGLGLTICRQFVALMGGEFDFTSKLGEGSTFWFEVALPAALPGVQSGGEARASQRMSAARPGALILLVDDAELNLEIGMGLLEGAGFKVEVARNGVEAVEEVKHKGYDAILMDCLMPMLDGYDAARQIRAFEGTERHTPIIAVTAAAMKSDRDRSIQAGMDDHLSKPLDLEVLLSTLAGWVPAGSGSVETTPPEPQRVQPESVLPSELRELAYLLPPDAFRRVCEKFLSTTAAALAELKAAAEEGNQNAVKAQAHKLKGSMATLGLTALSSLAEQVEDNPIEDLTALLALIDGMFEGFKSAKLLVEPLLQERLSG